MKVLLDFTANTNARDINEITPLHIAFLRNHKHMVALLVNANTYTTAHGKFGNTPAAFMRNKKIIDMIINPISEPLHKICSTPFLTLNIRADELNDILLTKSFVPGITTAKNVVLNTLNYKGMNPLTTAIIYSNIDAVIILKIVGIDQKMEDSRGLTSFVWLQLTKNARIKSNIETSKEDTIELFRIREAIKSSPKSKMLLFHGNLITNNASTTS